MRWMRFDRGGRPSFGIVEGDRVQPVEGSPFEEWQRAGRPVDLGSVHFLPPVMPPTLYACGVNYVGHAKWSGRFRTIPWEPLIPKTPEVGYRAQSALTGHNTPIVLPSDASEVIHYEAELAVVIGRPIKNATPDNAMSCVFGYTIMNDMSDRTWQFADRTFWRSKNSDTFNVLGPWIDTDADLDGMTTSIVLNGVLQDSFKTNNMIFSIADYIVAMTRYITLQPGDVITMGTDEGSPYVKHGDQIDITIAGIGTLSNPVRRDGIG